jgi:hypothetical protein
VITRLKAKRYADLISTICLGSGGQGGWRRYAAGLTPAASGDGGSSPEMAVLALQGAIWVAVWCKRTSVKHVTHWSTQGGGSVLRRGSPWREAALVRWRGTVAWFRPRFGSGFATGSVYAAWIIFTGPSAGGSAQRSVVWPWRGGGGVPVAGVLATRVRRGLRRLA